MQVIYFKQNQEKKVLTYLNIVEPGVYNASDIIEALKNEFLTTDVTKLMAVGADSTSMMDFIK